MTIVKSRETHRKNATNRDAVEIPFALPRRFGSLPAGDLSSPPRDVSYGLICLTGALATSVTKSDKNRAILSRPGVDITSSPSPVV